MTTAYDPRGVGGTGASASSPKRPELHPGYRGACVWQIASARELDRLTGLKHLSQLLVNNNPFLAQSDDTNTLRTCVAAWPRSQ